MSNIRQTWDANKTYHRGDIVIYNNLAYECVAETSLGDNPGVETSTTWGDYAISSELPHGAGYNTDDSEEEIFHSSDESPTTTQELQIWKQIEYPTDAILSKVQTVMDKGYSGDTNIWSKDAIDIDTAGWVYINNEITGINVKGADGGVGEVRFESLTQEQREMIRGEQGLQGAKGDKGDKGEKGDTGAVEWDHLTEEQIAMLRGDRGLSAYEVWLQIPGNEGKSVEDYIRAITGPAAITVDPALNGNSANPVENRAIYAYIQQLTSTINDLQTRVLDLEDRLKYTRNGIEYLFKFGITADKEYGYIKKDTTEVTPFTDLAQPQLFGDFTTNMGLFADGYISTGEGMQITQDLVAEGLINTDNEELQFMRNPVIASLKGVDESNVVSAGLKEDTPPTTSVLQVDMTGRSRSSNVLASAAVSPIVDFNKDYESDFVIYHNGYYNSDAVGFDSYSMNYDGSISENKYQELISKGTRAVEGIWFPSAISVQYDAIKTAADGTQTAVPVYPHYLNFTIEPLNDGDEITVVCGRSTSDEAQLPNLVTTGTYRDGDLTPITITSSHTFNLHLQKGMGAFIASMNNSPKFKITDMWLEGSD